MEEGAATGHVPQAPVHTSSRFSSLPGAGGSPQRKWVVWGLGKRRPGKSARGQLRVCGSVHVAGVSKGMLTLYTREAMGEDVQQLCLQPTGRLQGGGAGRIQ